MKVLFFLGSLQTGGAEKQVTVATEALARRGHDVHVVTLYPGGQFWDRLAGGGAVRVCALFRNFPTSGWGFRSRVAMAPMVLRRLLQREDPDVVYSMLDVTNAIAWLASRGRFARRLVWGVRGTEPRATGVLGALAFRVGASLSRSIRLVVSNSLAGKGYYAQRGFAPERWAVVPNGIDTDAFRPDPEGRAAVRKEWGIGEDQLLIGMVGRLDPHKDHGTFLRAASEIYQSNHRAVFACVGSSTGPEARQLRSLVSELRLQDVVRWAGERVDMCAVYNAIDVLCLPSRSEGFPNVVGEAMACGVPCVVTNSGDSALIVGGTGTIAPVADPTALATAVLDTVAEEVSTPECRRTRVQEHFSVPALAESLEREFLALCSGEPRTALDRYGHSPATSEPGARLAD